jgi:mRNA-degrading endonuclease toxin of MazEF toxin-antitoxin module
MLNFSKSEVVLVRYPFSDLSNSKVRPAVIVGTQEVSKDVFIVPLTSKLSSLISGEFVLSDWRSSGLNVLTAVKRGLYTIDSDLILKSLGRLSPDDANQLDGSLRL